MAAMSKILSIGLLGVSIQTRRVFGRMAARTRFGSRHVEERRLDAELLQHLVEDAERAAVDVVADEHVVAALQREQDGRRRRAAAAERDAVLAALERGEAPLERGARRVAGARVVVALVQRPGRLARTWSRGRWASSPRRSLGRAPARRGCRACRAIGFEMRP